jgi:dipeptidyl aminopeptidase/acylaminoacyl peptidase
VGLVERSVSVTPAYAPRGHEPSSRKDPNALIEEARHRARGRRLRNGACVSIAAAVVVAGFLVVRGNGGSPLTSGLPSLAQPNPAASDLRTDGQLTVIGDPAQQEPIARADGWYGLSTVGPGGMLHHLVRCPGHAKWCGEVESLDWSANGRWLALSVTSYGEANPYNGIHVVDLTTGVDRQIRSCRPGIECDWFDLAWSPDGTRLAYATQGGRIYIVSRDGSGRHALATGTGTAGLDLSPSWSADGTRIAFAARPSPDDPSSVYIVGSKGGGRILLASGASAPAWSPDGATIAFASKCGGIKLVTPAGKDITPGQGSCRTIGVSGAPIWSPDSTQIAIAGHASTTTGTGIYVMDATGKNLTRVTSQVSGRQITGRPDASWQPRRSPGPSRLQRRT